MSYLKSALMIAAVSLLGSMLLHAIALTNLAMLYILVVVITAIKWGKGPSLFAAVLSVLVFDFFFVPPKYSLTVAHVQYLIAFATLFVVGLVISTLALRAKEQAQEAKNREVQTLALYNLSKDLVKAGDFDKLYELAIGHIHRTVGANATIFVKSGDELKTISPGSGYPFDEAEKNAAWEVLTSGKPAGWNAEPAATASTLYLPLNTGKESFGVIGVKFDQNDRPPSREQCLLLETFVNQIAFAFERLRLAEEVGNAKLLREAEKLQTAFLNSVSHDLRTPLASISGSLSSLIHNPGIIETDKKILLDTAAEEANKLNQFVGDLLDMARVEAGALKIHRKPVEVGDLIRTSLEHMGKALSSFRISVIIPDGLPEVQIDFTLMLRVITNILDNAVKYSADDRRIEIAVERKTNDVEIRISDRGLGIPAADLALVFDKFYRTRRPKGREGTGLGLSVCKGIVEAHGGKIWAENSVGGGAIIHITLPMPAESPDGR